MKQTRYAVFLILLLSFSLAANVTYTYDAAGHVTTINYGNGSVVTYTYDSAGNLITRAATGALTAQTITFGALSNQPYGTPPFTVSATASSGLPVSFASMTTSVCTVSGSTVTLVAAGTCTIQATQAGNASYAAAPTVNQSFQVVAETTLTPATLSFGNQAINESSPAKTATFKNTQTVAVTISSIIVSGANPADFVPGGNCPISPSTLGAGKSCGITVTFTPSILGSETATLTVTNNAPTSPQTLALTGTGVAPVTLAPAITLDLGAVATGETSAAKTVTLTNHENIQLNFTSILASARFAIATNTCGTNIAAGATCTVGVTFSPTATGAATGTLTFTDDAANSPQVLALTGTGVAPVTLAPAITLDLGAVATSETSAAKTVTLTNHENIQLNFTSILPSAGFTVATNTCGTSIAAGATCTVGVTFAASAIGAATGTLIFTDDAANSPQTLALTGTGVAPVTLAPAITLDLGAVATGETSAAKTVTLTNHENIQLNFTSILASARFAIATNTCGTNIAARATCTVGVTFSPTATGAATGTLTFTDDAANSPQVLALTGTGVAPVTLAPAITLDLGAVATSETSAAKTVTLTNHENIQLNFTSILPSAGFTVATNTCGTSIAAGATCTVGVTFAASAIGAATGTLIFTDDAANSPQALALTGTGVVPVTLVPAITLDLGAVATGETSAAKTVTLTNHENIQLNFTSILASAGFAIATNTCGTNIAARATCTVGVTFSPTATGAATGTLTFTDDAANSPQVLALTGTGVAPVTLAPAITLDLGAVATSETSAAKTVTLTNHENIQLNFTSILASAGFAIATNTCGTSVAAGTTCTVGVTFSPTVTGAATGALTFTDDAAGNSQAVALTGMGITPVTLSASTLNFGTVAVGTSSPAKTVTLTNHENIQVNFNSILASTGFLITSNTCGPNIAAGTTCTVGVTFSPTSTGAANGTLTFTDDAANSAQAISLTGTGK